MGKGHNLKKKISALVSKGQYKKAETLIASGKLSATSKRISRSAAKELGEYLKRKIALRRKLNKGGKKGYEKYHSKLSESIRFGMSKAKEARRQEKRIADRRLRPGD